MYSIGISMYYRYQDVDTFRAEQDTKNKIIFMIAKCRSLRSARVLNGCL